MPDVRVRYGDMRELAPLLEQMIALGPSRDSEVRERIFRRVERVIVDEAPCHDCRVPVGELHVRGCDAEVCAGCLRQAIGCGCVS